MAGISRKVEIATIDCTTKILSFEVERPFGDAIAECTIEFVKSVDTLVTLSVGQSVEVFRNFTGDAISDPADLIFKGEIVKFEPDGVKIKVMCKDALYAAVRSEVNRTFLDTDSEAGKISEIFSTIINDHVGLTADSGTVQDSGTTLTIARFICNRANALERLNALANSMGWQFYYRPDTDKVYFEPKGYTSNANTLTVGTEIVEVPKWENDSQEMINDLYVIGGQQWVETTQTFNGDNSNKTFTLDNKPESTKVYISSVLQKGGLDTVTTNPDYTVDREEKEINFVSAPAVGTDNVEVRYMHVVPIPLHMIDSESQDTYNTRTRSVTLVDVKTIDDAATRGRKILEEGKTPNQYAVLKIRKHDDMDIQVGQSITIVDSINSVNDEFIINRYVMRFPLNYDEIHVGEKEFQLADLTADILTKLKRLDEDQNRNPDITVDLIQAGDSISIARKSRTITKRYIADSFILGHPENGRLGRGAILDDMEVA